MTPSGEPRARQTPTPATPTPATPPTPGVPAVIEARGVRKVFPGVVANDRVDFAVRPGEVHALLGENGAGKSTLASVLTGLYQPDEGEVWVAGQRVHLSSPRDGLAHGVGMVHQHFRLVPRFTVAENIALGDQRQPAVLGRARMEAGVAALGERYGLRVDPRAVTGALSVGEQQRVEIVKTLHRGVDVLLMDEPTAVLTPQEADALFATLRHLAADGKAVVFISHKLGEVMAVSDRVTVMRDGRVVGTVDTANTDTHGLATLMVGREVDLSPLRAEQRPGPCVLQATELSLDGEDGRTALHRIDLEVHAGEIVGIAGVAGNGQVPLAEVLAGIRAPTSGTVRIGEVDVTGRGTVAARAAGLAYVPEDRLGTGLCPSLSISDNLLLTRPRPFLLNRRGAQAQARSVIDRFAVKTVGPEAATRSMSGGNVQKVLLARELDRPRGDGGRDERSPQAIVVASPTRGLDVGSVEFVRGLLDERRRAGYGILLISEDLDEVRALSDRILVLYEGRIVMERRGETADVTELGLAMAGALTGSR